MHELEKFYLGFMFLLFLIPIIVISIILIRYKLKNSKLKNWAIKNNLKYIDSLGTGSRIKLIISGFYNGNKIFLFNYFGSANCVSYQEEKNAIKMNSFLEMAIDFLSFFTDNNPVYASTERFLGYTFINGSIYQPNLLTRKSDNVKIDEIMSNKDKYLYDCKRISSFVGNGTSEEIYIAVVADIFMKHSTELGYDDVRNIVRDFLTKVNMTEDKLLDLWMVSQENITEAIELIKNNYSINSDMVARVVDSLIIRIRSEHESLVASIKKDPNAQNS